MPDTITKTRAVDAARQFVEHRHKLGKFQDTDLLMGQGRHYELAPGTPRYSGPLTIKAIATFLQEHAVEIV